MCFPSYRSQDSCQKSENINVIVEQVSAMPGQGVTSMFNFGQSFGVIKGVCAAMQLPIFFVRPAKWKKHFDLINSQKDSSRVKAIEIKGQGELIDQPPDTYQLKRLVLKTQSNNFPQSTIYSTNVQNVYKDNDKYLVATGSIPSYYAQPLNASTQATTITGTFSGTEFEISPDKDHGFYTGDAVYYIPEKIEEKYFTAGGKIATRVSIGTKLFEAINIDSKKDNKQIRTYTLPSDRTAKNFYESNRITARVLIMEQKRSTSRYKI